MLAKAARLGVRFIEVPVSYHRRIGKSKITGTVKGTVLAGYKILTTILRLRVEGAFGPSSSEQKIHA